MKNKAQSFKKSMNHLMDYNNRVIINNAYSICWSYGDSSDKFNVSVHDEGGYRVACVREDMGGCWVLRYENRRGRKLMETLMVEPAEKEFINLESYFEDILKPTDEEANLFCSLFANLSGFLVEVSNRILEEEVNCGE